MLSQMQMEEPVVRVVSVTDVACATTQTATSAHLALEINNAFLLHLKREKKSILEELDKQQHTIKLNISSVRLKESLEKATGKLSSRFRSANGGSARKRIKAGKTNITLHSGDMVDVAAVEEQLQQTEVRKTSIT